MSISACYQVEDTSWIQVSILAVVNALIYPFIHLVYCMFSRFVVLDPLLFVLFSSLLLVNFTLHGANVFVFIFSIV